MSKGIFSFIAQKTAEAEAARILYEAIQAARAVLVKAKVDDPDDVLQSIWDADAEE